MEVFNQIMNDLHSLVRFNNIQFEDIIIIMHPTFRHELLCSMGFGYMSMADQLYHNDKFKGCDVIVTSGVDLYQLLVKPQALRSKSLVDWRFGSNVYDHTADTLSYVAPKKTNKQAIRLNEVKW